MLFHEHNCKDPLHMARVQDPHSYNARYYAYVHIGVLCIEEYAPNLVVDDDLHVLWTIFMYYGLFHVSWKT
jgi:hypothetical protein